MTISVTVCSTWMRGFTSMKENAPGVDVDEELDRAGVVVAHGARECERGADHAVAERRVEMARRRLFDHFLVAALHRAVALAEMDDVAVRVAEDLDLDVARVLDVLLDVDLVVAERRDRFLPRDDDLLAELRFVAQHAHTATASAPTRF